MSKIYNSNFNYFFDKAIIKKNYIEKNIINQINLNNYKFKKNIRTKYVKEYFLKLFFLKNTQELNLIYENLLKNKKNIFYKILLNYLLYLIYILFSSLYLLRFFIYFLDFSKKINSSVDVLYIQRKAKNTSIFFIYDSIYENSKKLDLSFSNSSLEFSFNAKGKINYLNSHKNFRYNILISYLVSVKHLFKDFKLLNYLSISFKDIRNYQLDLFKMNIIKNLNSSIIFGSLFDKPQFILLSLYKKDFQKICSFSDGFTFHPMPKPDFNFCDTYYSMCDDERYLINKNGGKIKRSLNVGIIRAIKNNDKNLSKNLKYKIKNFNKVVTVCTFQGDETDRTKINKSLLGKSICEILNHFLNEIFLVSQNNPNIIFLIKEKKGELDFVSPKIIDFLYKSKNIFIIKCKHPADLNENTFSDLLDITDVTISAALNSTTIFETLKNDKNVLIYKHVKFRTPWDKYDEIYYKEGELDKKLSFLLNLTDTQKLNLISKISSNFNLNFDSIQLMLKDINKQLNN